MNAKPNPPFIGQTRAVFSVALILSMLTGCISGLESNSTDFVGTWIHRGPHLNAQIVLSQDGTASVASVPRAVIAPGTKGRTVDWNDVLTEVGTWKASTERQNGLPTIDVFLPKSPGFEGSNFNLEYSQVATESQIFSLLDEATDDRFVFKRG